MAGCSSAEFAEVFAQHLCLPSVVCAGRVGEKVGKGKVDKFGDKVTSEALGEDGRRAQHRELEVALLE